MARTAILGKYFMMIKDVRVVVETASHLATPFLSILFTFYLLTFEYIVLGEAFFGAAVTYREEPLVARTIDNPFYIRLNFNDFFGSLMVLWMLILSNNWDSIVDMHCAVVGANIWPKLYFCSFYFFVGLIMLNIVISFVLELFDDMSAQVARTVKREKNVATLARAMPNGEGLPELLKSVRRSFQREAQSES